MKRFACKLPAISGALIAVLMLAPALSGCASKGGDTFSSSDQQRAYEVRYGVVESVRTVMIDQDPSLLGSAIGGVAGGFIGNLFGSGSGKTLATIGGAAAGALGGYYAEKGIRKHEALEITVTLDDGRQVAVVQDADDYYAKGDRVRLIYGQDGSARVQHR